MLKYIVVYQVWKTGILYIQMKALDFSFWKGARERRLGNSGLLSLGKNGELPICEGISSPSLLPSTAFPFDSLPGLGTWFVLLASGYFLFSYSCSCVFLISSSRRWEKPSGSWLSSLLISLSIILSSSIHFVPKDTVPCFWLQNNTPRSVHALPSLYSQSSVGEH